MHIVDRRLNPGGKSLPNRQRFLRRIKDMAQRSVRESAREKDIKDLGKDGRVTVPGSRWVTGEESRSLVHELRAESDAVAVGMGTVRADDPRLDARGVAGGRQPRAPSAD